MMNEILERWGIKYEDLNTAERETLNKMLEDLSKTQLTLDKVRDYISNMKDSVEQELTKTGLNSKQDLFLKARLRNYMLLEAFLSTPERAKKALEQAMTGLVK
jgi:hypothetical protein